MQIVVSDRKLTLAETSSLSTKYRMYLLSQALDFPNGTFYELSPEEKKRLNYEFLNHCLAFGGKIIQGQSLSETISFGKTNIWLYHKFRLYFELINFCYDYSALKALVRKHGELTFYTKNSLFTKISEIPSGVTVIFQSEPKQPVNVLNVLRLLILLSIRFFKHVGQIKKARAAKFLIFNRPVQETPMRVPPDLSVRNENPYYGFLFSHVNSDTLVLEEFEFPKLRDSQPFRLLRRLWKPRKECPHLYGDSMLIRKLLDKSIRKQVAEASKVLEQFYPLLTQEAKSVYEQILAYKLESLHNSSRYYLFRYFAYQSFFSNSQLERMLSGDEGSPTIKSILDAGKACGIETLGLQHGAIHPLHITYRFSESDVAQAHPMPDKTLIWGSYWGKILQTHGQYTPDQLILVGQARTDIIPYLGQLSQEKVLDVPQEKRLVVFASQPQRDPKLRRQAAEDVFRSVGSHPNIHLLVKLHPRETDLSYHASIAEAVGCTNYSQNREIDLYSLLAVCEVLITCFSTVGAEAVYFGKPLIIL
ncbi:MAG: hypothetical protein AAGA10_12425, partial [Bacteroidota bacterium]